MAARGRMNTGELAAKAGVNKETIRFYEKKGLLPEPLRTPGGFRLFDRSYLRRIMFIRNAKGLGFSLEEIRELLSIADGEKINCREIRGIAKRRLDFIENRIISLTRLKQVLSSLVEQCRKADRVADCPIIESLTEEV